MSTSVSAVTNHFPSAEAGFITTLSGTVAPSATTVGLNNLDGYTTGEVATFIVDPNTPAAKQVFTGIVDVPGLQLTDVVWTAGNNQSHAAGTTVVDYVTATHISQMSKGMLVEHDQDGTHKTSFIAQVSPPGMLAPYAGSSAPSGWLLADGTAVSRTTYASLYAVIGTSYGAGDGSTTFNLPNLKGKIPVGLDAAQTEFDALAETGGAKTHTLTSAEMPTHSHGVTDPGHVHSIAQFNNVNYTGTGFNLYGNYGGGSSTSYAATTGISIQNAGSGGAHNNLQPYVVTNYIIKV